MEKIKLSKRVFRLVFASKFEAVAFRNADYAKKLAANIARRAEHRTLRASGTPVTRPAKLPRRPECVDICRGLDGALMAQWCAKHGDYWRVVRAGGNPLPGKLV